MIRPGGMDALRYVPTTYGGEPADEEGATEELKETMERKDIPNVEDMLEMVQLEGLRFLACKTSTNLFDRMPATS